MSLSTVVRPIFIDEETDINELFPQNIKLSKWQSST